MKATIGEEWHQAGDTRQRADMVVKAPRPKLPAFDEAKDDVDTYLERFERFVKARIGDQKTGRSALALY